MEGLFMEEPLSQKNKNNTVDEGIRLESGRDVKRSRSDVQKMKDSVLLSEKGKDVLKLSPTASHGSLSICGRRREMQDTVSIFPRLMLSNQQPQQQQQEPMVLDFFGVYDGHGGAIVADICRDKLHFLLIKEINESLEEGNAQINWNRVLENSFVQMDAEVDEFGIEVGVDMKSIGSTALVCLVSMNQIIVANCGDCRAILCRQGHVVPLSRDHKPDTPEERQRVEQAGGRVLYWNGWRVGGVLATSRSIGDQDLKPYVTSVPEVTITSRSKNDEFIILATDGLWDVITNEIACEVVTKVLQGRLRRRVPKYLRGTRANEAATVLTELAVSGRSNDNISVIVIELNKIR